MNTHTQTNTHKRTHTHTHTHTHVNTYPRYKVNNIYNVTILYKAIARDYTCTGNKGNALEVSPNPILYRYIYIGMHI